MTLETSLMEITEKISEFQTTMNMVSYWLTLIIRYVSVKETSKDKHVEMLWRKILNNGFAADDARNLGKIGEAIEFYDKNFDDGLNILNYKNVDVYIGHTFDNKYEILLYAKTKNIADKIQKVFTYIAENIYCKVDVKSDTDDDEFIVKVIWS